MELKFKYSLHCRHDYIHYK